MFLLHESFKNSNHRFCSLSGRRRFISSYKCEEVSITVFTTAFSFLSRLFCRSDFRKGKYFCPQFLSVFDSLCSFCRVGEQQLHKLFPMAQQVVSHAVSHSSEHLFRSACEACFKVLLSKEGGRHAKETIF